MPADDTRRLLKIFGMAVTRFEDAVREKATPDEIRAAEVEVRLRLQEVAELIDRLKREAAVEE